MRRLLIAWLSRGRSTQGPNFYDRLYLLNIEEQRVLRIFLEYDADHHAWSAAAARAVQTLRAKLDLPDILERSAGEPSMFRSPEMGDSSGVASWGNGWTEAR